MATVIVLAIAVLICTVFVFEQAVTESEPMWPMTLGAAIAIILALWLSTLL